MKKMLFASMLLFPVLAWSAPSGAGRYQIVFSPRMEKNTFLIDTVTGKVWQLTEFTDLNGKPVVWVYMDRVDNDKEMLNLANKYEPAPKSPNATESTSQPNAQATTNNPQFNYSPMAPNN